MAIVNPKTFDQMTLAELRAELAHWERWATTLGGSALALAIDCRDLCATWVARREREATGVAA